MATFKNISDTTFIDGNITVLPGQTLTVNDESRIDQLTNQYGWQFSSLEDSMPKSLKAHTTDEPGDDPAASKVDPKATIFDKFRKKKSK